MTNVSMDEDCCGYCGVRMDVIGPPGPRHRTSCPVEIEARADSRATRDRDRVFLSTRQGRQPCGCFVAGESILEICLKPTCAILNG